MPHVSLILPTSVEIPSPETIDQLAQAVEQDGHDVEVVLARDPALRGEPIETIGGRWRSILADNRGLSAAAIAGLDVADGELLIVLDPTMGYNPADLPMVLAPLVDRRADLVVASRCLMRGGRAPQGLRDHLRRGVGLLARPLTGTTDPMSGLIALNRAALDDALSRFQPIGAHFSFEILAKVQGRWVEVPVQTGPTRPRPIGLDEIRHLKRLSDHRFGNLSRLLQFCVVGASGMVVDLSCYALFQWLFRGSWLARHTAPLVGGPLDLAAAGLVAIWIALTWNFFLNRHLTFNDARGGSLIRQYLTYALSNALGITLSLSLRLLLPRFVPFFSAHKLMAAVVGIVAATGVSFTMARWLVFKAPKRPTGTGRLETSPDLSTMSVSI